MEVSNISSNTIELASAMGGAACLIRVASEMPTFPQDKFRSCLDVAIRLCIQERNRLRHNLNVSDEEHTDERLDQTIAVADLLASEVESVVQAAELNKSLLVRAGVWYLVNNLSVLADDFRDLQETYALGRSKAFQERVKKARQEAAG